MRGASKSPDAFRTISEVATDLDVPQHVLRFWETKFAQVKPLKRAGGRRYYRPEDLDLLRGIRTLLYTDGFTIKGVKKVLREQGVRYVIETGRMVGQADRTLPVTHSGSLEATTNPDLMVEDEAAFEGAQENPELTVEPLVEPISETLLETPIAPAPRRIMADQPIESLEPTVDPGLTNRQRSALESILEELLELKLNLNGAKKALGSTRVAGQQDFLSSGDISHVA